MKFAFYKVKGNPKADWLDKIIVFFTGGNYSHVELVFSDGIAFSSSGRDGGTRFKRINFNPKRWDLIEFWVPPDIEGKIRLEASKLLNKKYDLIGAITSPWGLCFENKDKYFCSEIALMLTKDYIDKYIKPCKYTPIKMYKMLNKKLKGNKNG